MQNPLITWGSCCCEQGCIDLPFTDYTVVEAACVTLLNGELIVGKTCAQNACTKVMDAVCCCEQGCIDLQYTDYTPLEASCVTLLNGTLILDTTCAKNPCENNPPNPPTGGCEKPTGGCEKPTGGCD